MTELIRYGAEKREEAIRLAREGLAYMEIARRLGIKRVSTVSDWARNARRYDPSVPERMSAGLVRSASSAERKTALERRDAYLRTLPPVLNPNITVLGDPLPGRSALDQKRAGQ
jgi:transposase-like protein